MDTPLKDRAIAALARVPQPVEPKGHIIVRLEGPILVFLFGKQRSWISEWLRHGYAIPLPDGTFWLKDETANIRANLHIAGMLDDDDGRPTVRCWPIEKWRQA
jgi:hypothetical protein